MQNFSFSSTNELKIFLKDKKFKKILIICGETSFKGSGADKIINNLLIDKKTEFKQQHC